MLLPPSILKGTAMAASEDSERYQIAGVFLERHETGPSATATDGKVLIHTTWKEPDHGEFPSNGTTVEPVEGFEATVGTADCLTMAKLPPKRDHRAILENVALTESEHRADPLTAIGTDLDSTSSHQVHPIDGQYPDYKSVLKSSTSKPPAITIRLDLFNLERILKAVRTTAGIGKKDNASAIFELYEPGLPVHIKFSHNGISIEAMAIPLVVEK